MGFGGRQGVSQCRPKLLFSSTFEKAMEPTALKVMDLGARPGFKKWQTIQGEDRCTTIMVILRENVRSESVET